MKFTNDSNYSEAIHAAHNKMKRGYKLGTTVTFADGVVIERVRGRFVRL